MRSKSKSSWTVPHPRCAPTPAPSPSAGSSSTPFIPSTPAPGEHQTLPASNPYLDPPARTVDANDPELIIEYLALFLRRSSRETIRQSDTEYQDAESLNVDQPLNERIRTLVDTLACIITTHPCCCCYIHDFKHHKHFARDKNLLHFQPDDR
ncbi:hypothetical protein E1B28_008253 [Marasmius oreades]|uniref:Uncharacterized protein n=1 Tax=Marasmius oreades TaxID=181124 RepID=A0A9P7RZ70_9AGAR|nr:uncharacterized protein E1B28_008253 [Marasmius oreades]KAG7091851.1 hypothetical protein E1B28_008253 [Marasmius oreades]